MKFRKLRKLILFGLTLLIVLIGWNFNHDGQMTPMFPVTATTTTQTCELESAVGLIYQVENDSNIPEGQLLCGGETLQLAPGAKVALICFEQGTLDEITSGGIFAMGEYCSAPEPAVECDDSGNLCGPDPRPSGSSNECDRPEIKSPSSKIISNSRPYIVWKPIADATGYTVTIKSLDADFDFQARIDNLSEIPPAIAFPYPDDRDSLTDEERYKVIVEAIGASSEKCIESDTTRFKLIQ